MLTIPKQALVKKCNAYCRDALDKAANLCVQQGNYEVTVAHFLHALLDQPASDVSKMLVGLGVDAGEVRALIARSFEQMKRGAATLPSMSPMVLELLQDAFVIATGELDDEEIRTGAILIAVAAGPDRYCHLFFYAPFEEMSAAGMRRDFKKLTVGSMEGASGEDAPAPGPSASANDPDSALATYGRCITEQAREGKIDPVFRRDAEIAQMSDVLCRRRKNNPILVGEAGVGKTALAEGLALKVIEEDVPAALLGSEIWELDLGALQAGASVKGEFERRLKAVLEESMASESKIILFIDEAHTLIGGGGAQGSGDAANLLKPALARGALRAIAATTWSEYKKYFEKDPALTRRFQLIKLDEPTPDQAVDMLRGMRGAYEDVHGVYITDAALHAAAALSARYITGRQLPDKALDVLDTACVRVAAAMTAKPRSLDFLEREIVLKNRALEALTRDGRARGEAAPEAERIALESQIAEFEAEAATLDNQWQEERVLVERILDARRALMDPETPEEESPPLDEDEAIDAALFGGESAGEAPAPSPNTTAVPDEDALRAELKAARAALDTATIDRTPLVAYEVSAEEVAQVIGDWTGIPASAMGEDDAAKVLELGDNLRAVILGQDNAVTAIHDRLKSARTDLVRTDAPRGVFLLVGPSGVGKTETALQVAEQLYGGKQFLTTINMSEYQEKHTVSRLIGSPPGYIGYGEGGLLTEAIRKKPYSVVLLDEVEKAHPDIMNLFFQAFDKGEINDGEGREIDCKNVVFFMTSNLGSEALTENMETVLTASNDALEKALRPHLLQHFKAALLARMHVICFKPLPPEIIERIIEHKLGQQAQRIADHQKVAFEWTPAVRGAIAGMCGHTENGARAVEQVIDRRLTPVIAEETLIRIAGGTPLEAIHLDLDEEDQRFRFEFLPATAQDNAMDTEP